MARTPEEEGAVLGSALRLCGSLGNPFDLTTSDFIINITKAPCTPKMFSKKYHRQNYEGENREVKKKASHGSILFCNNLGLFHPNFSQYTGSRRNILTEMKVFMG